MINNLLFPDIIERVDDPTGVKERQYVSGGKSFSSVNQIINYHQPKDFLVQWKKRVGETEAARITQTASQDGSKVHECAEKYFTKEELPELNTRQNQCYKQLLPFLDGAVKTCIAQELRVKYFAKLNRDGVKDENGMECSVGGTFDSLLTLDTTKLINQFGEPIFENEEETFLVDYKTQSKKKSPRYMLNYYTQISGYSGAINQLTEGKYKINKGLIVAVTSRSLTLWYLDPRAIMFYWVNFLEMLAGYFYKEKINWTAFENTAKGFYYNGSSWIFDSTHVDYMPQQIYLKDNAVIKF